MPKLTIDNRPVEVSDGATILDAAKKLGIRIPTLCYLPSKRPCTSCFVCVVKLAGRENLVPACATAAEDGAVIFSETPEVHQARRLALELLLSDHLGDCEGPCHRVCPAHMNIPRMIRQIAAGDLAGAIQTVKADIALPATLGRICPAPCERACRRGAVDEPLSIMLLKRHVADADLASPQPYLPACKAPSGKKVAIVGAGPAGLAAAYYLLQDGHACTIFDQHDRPGGLLRYAVEEARLPSDVLDGEIEVIRKLGAIFRMNTQVGRDISPEKLRADFDAVVIATGKGSPQQAPLWPELARSEHGLEVNPHSLQTPLAGVFAGGDVVRSQKLAVRSVADGKIMAHSIRQLFAGQAVVGEKRTFNVHIGHPRLEELPALMNEASKAPRQTPAAADVPLTSEQAKVESSRCMHCDCRKALGCRLRVHCQAYEAHPARFKSGRRSYEVHTEHPHVIFEPGKCIDCGLCIQIASDAREELGLSFVGRGFAVRVAVPFGEGMDKALQKVASECARACPTAAIVMKK